MITRWFNFVFIILVHIQRNKKAAARQRILKPFQLLGNMTIIWSDIFGKHPKDSSTPWRTENSLLQHRRYMSGVNRGQTLKKTYSSKECLLKRRTWQLGNSALRNFLMMIPSGTLDLPSTDFVIAWCRISLSFLEHHSYQTGHLIRACFVSAVNDFSVATRVWRRKPQQASD